MKQAGSAPKDERCQAVLLGRNAICRYRWTRVVTTKSGRPMKLCALHQRIALTRELDQLPLAPDLV